RTRVRRDGRRLRGRAGTRSAGRARSASVARAQQRARDRPRPGDRRPHSRARRRAVPADHPRRRHARTRRRGVSLLPRTAPSRQLPAEAAGEVTSIYQAALGSDFDRLHPQIQRRFGFSSEDGCAAIGRGVMDRVWHGLPYTLPFLSLGTWRRIMFPQSGRDVPFSIYNYAYRDGFGRETVTWNRDFAAPLRRRFDATMIYSDRRGRTVDYLGTHQHLAVDIDLSVDKRPRRAERRASRAETPGRVGPSGFANAEAGLGDDRARRPSRIDKTKTVSGNLLGPRGNARRSQLCESVALAGRQKNAQLRS